jgi:uracil phosphoribosyltransferase
MYSNIKVKKIDHPLLRQKLSFARDRDTGYVWFRDLIEEMSRILAVHALSSLKTETVEGKNTRELISRDVVLFAQMQSGLAMIKPFIDLYPLCKIGYIGLNQDNEEGKITQYYLDLPIYGDSKNIDIFYLVPAIGKGYRAVIALGELIDAGIAMERIRIVSLLASHQGLEMIDQFFDKRKTATNGKIKIFTSLIDITPQNHDVVDSYDLGPVAARLSGISS